MLDSWKMVEKQSEDSIRFCGIFPSLKQNFIAYRSYKVSSLPDCIFEIHQLWQSVFSRVYSNCCCSCSLEPEIIKIGQSFYMMYSNSIGNLQEFTTILNACTKKSGNVLNTPRTCKGISIKFMLRVKCRLNCLIVFCDSASSWFGINLGDLKQVVGVVML